MAVTINASASSSGLVTTADGSGIVKLQSNGKTTNSIGWLNFNAGSSSPITARSSYNFSSVTKSATGSYSVSFIASASDANYVMNYNYSTQGVNSAGFMGPFISTFSGTTITVPTTTTFIFTCSNAGNTIGIDPTYVMLLVFGN